MAMDTVFDFDNQEYVSEVIVFKDFFKAAMRSRNYLKSFGIRVGDRSCWENDFVSSYGSLNLMSKEDVRASKELVDSLIEELRHPTKQYNFDKDDGRGRMALPKKAHLSCMNHLLAENEKKRNPQYKSIVLRSMQYDRFDTSVICHSIRGDKLKLTKLSKNSHEKRDTNNNQVPSQKEVVVKEEAKDSFPSTNAYTLLANNADLTAKSDTQRNAPSKNALFYNPYEDTSPAISINSNILDELTNSSVHHSDTCMLQRSQRNLEHDTFAMEPLSKVWKPDPDYCESEEPMCFTNQNVSTPNSQMDFAGQLTSLEQFTPIFEAAHLEGSSSNLGRVPANTSMTLPSYPPLPSFVVASQKDTNCSPNPLCPPSFKGNGMDGFWDSASGPLQSLPPKSNDVVVKKEPEDTYPEAQATSSNFVESMQPRLRVVNEEFEEDTYLNDIVAQVSIHVGYPRPLEKQEVRLGRLLKVLDRFLILGSNTLKDLKNAIDCPSDNHVFEDVSERPVRDDDLCKSRYPSSYFFFHDTFYIDLEPKGSQDITSEIRSWAIERGLGETKVADMNTTRIVDLKCRLGAPYLYVHVGSCEHLISFNNLALRDKCHPRGNYPLPIFERNSRRIACAGCKEVTAEWVVWDHEGMPSPVQYFCDSCYKDFNFDVFGKKIFTFKAAPLYDRHNRKLDFSERAVSNDDWQMEDDDQSD